MLPGTWQPLPSFFAHFLLLPPLFKSSLVLSRFPVNMVDGTQDHFPLPTPVSYSTDYLVHLHFCLARKTNFPSWGSRICVSVCLKSNIIDQPVPSIPASSDFSEGSGLPWQWDFKITPKVKHRKSVETSLPKHQLPAQPTVLDSSSGLHPLLDYLFSPQFTVELIFTLW